MLTKDQIIATLNAKCGYRKFRTDSYSCIVVNRVVDGRVDYTVYLPSSTSSYNDELAWFAEILTIWGSPRVHPTVGA